MELYILTGIVIAAALFLAMVLMKQPRGDRNWSPALSEVAVFEETAPSKYTLTNIRAFEYGLDGPLRREWVDAEVNADQLKEIWYFIEPFAGTPLFAHSYLSFVFGDASGSRKTLSVSVEARKEAGEDYSAVKGLFREFELLYVWSTEKDVHSRIAIKLDHTLYAYKLNLPHDQAKTIFEHFVTRTNKLAESPRFYNTLHSNCTNELAKAVNEAFPGALPWHRSWVVTGRSAKWLHKLGFIEGGASFDEITANADIQPLVKTHATHPADIFDDAWRAAWAAKN